MKPALIRLSGIFILALSLATNASGSEFHSLFDGKSLDGWNAKDMTYWSVTDGAITAESTTDHPGKKNQFLVWQLGDVDDFVLRLKFKIDGPPNANSGIQFRSVIKEEGHAVGYQADIDKQGNWLGSVYDEHTSRKALAKRGQRLEIDNKGERTLTDIGDAAELFKKFNSDGWNDYQITAKGSKIQIHVNGALFSEVIDHQSSERDFSGKLALQLHSGPPLKVQFKDIKLKRLPLAEDRKKVVFLAGNPSHAPGDHEHNAGSWLLAKCLNDTVSDKIQANVYFNNGWPADPSAFDNANAIVIYCDGGGRHLALPKLKELDAMMDKGIGLGCLHYGVEVPKGEPGDAFLDMIGGYFETHFSVNPHWIGDFKKLPDHPVTNGVKPYKIQDEWYYHMRFRPGMKGVTPILSARPPEETRTARWGYHHGGNEHVAAAKGQDEVVMWTSENNNGSRGFGFTGGHHHKNWGDENHRKVVLNAILWVAKQEVPKNGVESIVTSEDLATGLDDKPARKPKKKKK
ncbi:DUF1080 domain-containing protein [Verrucomicrobia bacterium]|nr:DUF1080 domain-containing protein [Verrucomicrobiota bacterium]